MYKKVLVPLMLNHSGVAEMAVRVAQLLKDEGGRITLLHVMEGVPEYIRSQLPDGVLEAGRKDALAGLQAIAGSTGIDAETVVVKGHAGRSICDYAKDNGINCIVVASHRPGLQDYFIGSTAAFVTRHAGCAVHVLR